MSRRRTVASLTVQTISHQHAYGNWPEDGKEHTELAELAVGDDEGAKSPQAVQSLVAVLLGRLVVNGGARKGSVSTSDVLGAPDEVLEELALVLGQEKELCLLDNVAEIGNELLALGTEAA
jgi:hypothetical protein